VRIAVGFKVTPDYEALRPTDWVRLAAAETPAARAEATRYVRRVLSVFDEAALELALRLRDARTERGLQTTLAAFTVGGREAAPFLHTLLALGFTTSRVDCGGAEQDGGLDFAPGVTAALVAACTQHVGGDVLLLGGEAGPGGSGTLPFLVAETLGRPCCSEVTEIETAEDALRVTFTADDRPVRATVAPPCVLAVGNAIVSMLRVPTLKARLAMRDHRVAKLSAAVLGVDVAAARASEAVTLVGLETVDRARASMIIEGATAAEKARALYQQHLRARLELL
jgi:electron transfer flavoprotein alpha/beta subunit